MTDLHGSGSFIDIALIEHSPQRATRSSGRPSPLLQERRRSYGLEESHAYFGHRLRLGL
jgi:hypothetical protein